MFRRVNPLLLLCLLAGIAWSGARAQNIFPDPGFEYSGVTDTARTGERAGYLKSEGERPFLPLGQGEITVKPFVTYRASAWVKAKTTRGQVVALYCYGWNSFDWAFVRSVSVPNSDEWQRVEVNFVSPSDTMNVHPLVFWSDAAGEAWVDDVVVEEVQGPEETMAPLLAKENPSKEEIQLLARYYVARGEVEKATALLPKAPDHYTRADIACVLALHSKDPADRRRFAVEMLSNGGPSYHNGVTRFNEITEGMSAAEKLAICREALEREPELLPAAQGFRSYVTEMVAPGNQPGTCADMAARLEPVRAAVDALLMKVPASSPAGTELVAAAKEVDAARQALAARRAALGQCRVLIGGKPLAPETHAIVIPAQPTPQEEFAARDLQAHLELITGAAIPLVKDGEVGARTPIVVGKAAELDRLG